MEEIRRQVYELSAENLGQCPIWEFCSDEEDVEGQDEATVRPTQLTEVPGYSPGAYIVAADTTLPDGRKLPGYLYSGRPDDVGCIQPTLIIGESQINVWFGSLRYLNNVAGHISRAEHLMDGGEGVSFPIIFTSRAKLNGALLRVVVEGFMARDDDGRITKVR